MDPISNIMVDMLERPEVGLHYVIQTCTLYVTDFTFLC